MLVRICAFATLVMFALFTLPQASAQDELHPIAKDVKASLKDPSKPFTILVHLKIKPGTAKKFMAAFAPAIKATLKEKGNIAYQLNRDAKNANEYLVYERWQNLDALNKHLKTKYITKLLEVAKEVLSDPPEVRVMLPAGG